MQKIFYSIGLLLLMFTVSVANARMLPIPNLNDWADPEYGNDVVVFTKSIPARKGDFFEVSITLHRDISQDSIQDVKIVQKTADNEVATTSIKAKYNKLALMELNEQIPLFSDIDEIEIQLEIAGQNTPVKIEDIIYDEDQSFKYISRKGTFIAPDQWSDQGNNVFTAEVNLDSSLEQGTPHTWTFMLRDKASKISFPNDKIPEITSKENNERVNFTTFSKNYAGIIELSNIEDPKTAISNFLIDEKVFVNDLDNYTIYDETDWKKEGNIYRIDTSQQYIVIDDSIDAWTEYGLCWSNNANDAVAITIGDNHTETVTPIQNDCYWHTVLLRDDSYPTHIQIEDLSGTADDIKNIIRNSKVSERFGWW